MKKGKSTFAGMLSLTLLILVSSCATAPSLPAQEPPVSAPEQTANTQVPPENYICGMVENWTETGAFSPVMTIPASGQVIALDVLIDDMLSNYAGQLPSNFMIFDPFVTEGQDLHGDPTFLLSGYSRYELVSSCP